MKLPLNEDKASNSDGSNISDRFLVSVTKAKVPNWPIILEGEMSVLFVMEMYIVWHWIEINKKWKNKIYILFLF